MVCIEGFSLQRGFAFVTVKCSGDIAHQEPFVCSFTSFRISHTNWVAIFAPPFALRTDPQLCICKEDISLSSWAQANRQASYGLPGRVSDFFPVCAFTEMVGLRAFRMAVSVPTSRSRSYWVPAPNSPRVAASPRTVTECTRSSLCSSVLAPGSWQSSPTSLQSRAGGRRPSRALYPCALIRSSVSLDLACLSTDCCMPSVTRFTSLGPVS